MINYTSSAIRIPVSLRRKNIEISKKINELKLNNQNDLSKKELTFKLGITLEELKTYFDCNNKNQLLSLNQEINEDGNTYETFLQDEKDYYVEIFDSEQQRIDRLLEVLTDKEKEVIIKRIGLNDEVMTLKEIADKLNISIERVRTIEVKSYRKMKNRAYKINNNI